MSQLESILRRRRVPITPPFAPTGEDEDTLSIIARLLGRSKGIAVPSPQTDSRALSTATPPFVEPQQPVAMPAVRPRIAIPTGNEVTPRTIPLEVDPNNPRTVPTDTATVDPSLLARTRPRVVIPVDPLVKASENLDALRRMPLDYGQDEQGNERTKPKKGFWGRAGAGIKTGAPIAAQVMAQTGSPVAGLAALLTGGAVGAARPSLPAEMRRKREIGEAEGTLGNVLTRRKAIGDLNEQQSMTDYRRSQIPYQLARPQIEQDKLAQKAAYDDWRMKSGDRKQDTYETWLEWRMRNGDTRTATYQDYVEFQKGATTRRLDQGDTRIAETARHNQEVERALGDYRKTRVELDREILDFRRQSGGRGTTPKSNAAVMNKARTAADNFERYKSLAITAPDVATKEGEKTKSDYLNAARMEANVLKNNYPDLFEVGESDGWPYVKPKGGGSSNDDPLGIR